MARIKEYVSGEGWYLLGPVPGAGFVTWQLTDDAVRFLRAHGLGPGDSVPLNLLGVLKRTGAAFTHGTGIGGPAISELFSELEPRVALVLRFASDEWVAGAEVAELPGEFFDSSSGVGVQLAAQCSVVLNGARVPAVRLWPGTGSTFVAIEPRARPYQCRLDGPWPQAWVTKLQAWTKPFEGFGDGRLFAGPEAGGRALRNHEPLECGQSYCFVYPTNRRWAPPSGLTCVVVTQGSWTACLASLPETLTVTVARFAEEMGRKAVQGGWRLELVAPVPVTFDGYGVSRIAPSNEFIVGAWPQGPHVDDALIVLARNANTIVTTRIGSGGGKPAFLSMPIDKAGLHSVTTGGGYANALLVDIGGTNALKGAEPSANIGPLSIRWQSKDQEASAEAFSQQTSEIVIGNGAEFQVRCPVQIAVTWSGADRGRSPGVGADQASKLLSTLAASARQRGAIQVEVDGGAFGRIRLTFRGPQPVAHHRVLGRYSQWRTRALNAVYGRQVPWNHNERYPQSLSPRTEKPADPSREAN